jgi:hypothetical protein
MKNFANVAGRARDRDHHRRRRYFQPAKLEDAIDIAQRTETTIFGISTKAGFLGSVPGVEAGTVKDKGDKYLTRTLRGNRWRAFFTGDMLALERRSKRSLKSFVRSTSSRTGRLIKITTDAERKVEVRFTDGRNRTSTSCGRRSSYRAVKDSLK